MAQPTKAFKWWLHDRWAALTKKSNTPEPKTVCVFHCRACGGLHHLKFQKIGSIEIDFAEVIPAGITIQCPNTGEMAHPASDDFEFLNQRELDLGDYRRK